MRPLNGGGRGEGLVQVHRIVVAGDLGEGLDVGLASTMWVRLGGLADAQFFETKPAQSALHVDAPIHLARTGPVASVALTRPGRRMA